GAVQLKWSKDQVATDRPFFRTCSSKHQFIEMIGHGMTTQEIARQLGLSGKTIETHRERIKVKLRLRNAAELSRQAVLWIPENG
ncbi:MAG: response regulator transcription factor, partial [Pirellulaceae bacterium]